MDTMVPRRFRASRGVLAWRVVRLPSWPVFMAWSMSTASGPRTSPTMIRSGRIRRELMTRERTVTSPFPSTLGAWPPGAPREAAGAEAPPSPRW
jgi:hypothetical protein